MINFRQAKILEILSHRQGVTRVEVDIDGKTFQALNYDDITGNIKTGDIVVLNTTAVELGLGTGGTHFVLWNLRHKSLSSTKLGHMKNSTELMGMPVIVGSLHSQLPAVVASIKELNPRLRIVYVMTDAAALPIALSDLVAKLKSLGLIDDTVTCGHAFGGDYEAVNIFSALIAAKEAAEADICVVMMGPGIVGTDTVLGYSGIEQGTILNAVGALRGTPIAIVRLHFADKRARHYGISHHSLTALSIATLVRSVIALPDMSIEKREIVCKQLKESGISSKHEITDVKNDLTIEALRKLNIDVVTMGRTFEEEPDFFRAAGAAGIYAIELLNGGVR